MKTPILDTARLRLRPIRSTDAPRCQELFPHPEILKYMAAAIPWPYPDDGAVTYIETTLADMAAETRYVWAITLKDSLPSREGPGVGPDPPFPGGKRGGGRGVDGDDLMIGCIDLFPNNPIDNRGFWLGLPYQRHGYMTEAVAAVNDFAFDVLGLGHLVLNNAEPNIGSHRLKEKAGATILEVNDGVAYVGGVFRQIRWILTREQWHANREGFLNSKTAPPTS